MEVQIRLKDEVSMTVVKQILTVDSRVFRYLIDELKYGEVLIDDFSPEAVRLFVTFLERKRIVDIRRPEFRELHKLAVVFEVFWLKEGCYEWLRKVMNNCSDNERESKPFIFDECSYIFKKWGEKAMMNEFISCFISQNNSALIKQYTTNIAKLNTFQINTLLKLGGSDAELFLEVLQTNLNGKTKLEDNIKYLLQNMNMAFCAEAKNELYLRIVDIISRLQDVSVADLRFILQLTTQTARMVQSRIENRKASKCTTTFEFDGKKYSCLLESCRSISDIPAVILEKEVSSMIVVVDLLLHAFPENPPVALDRANTKTWLTTIEDICRERGLQKVSKRYLDAIITALNYSYFEQADELITLLNEIKNSEILATQNETITVNCVVSVAKEKGKRYLFHFQHPVIKTCTRIGKCGFMLENLENKLRLCTYEKDYEDTGIHFHDVVGMPDMFMESVRTGNTAYDQKITVQGRYNWEKKWLPFVTDWKITQYCVEYDISDYLIAKRDYISDIDSLMLKQL